MTKEDPQDISLGVILSATVWIFSAVMFFSSTSHSGRFSFIPIIMISLIGTALLFIGWGVLSFKSWAYYSSVAIPIIGFFCLAIGISLVGLLYFVFFISSIPATAYLVMNKHLYLDIPTQNNYVQNQGRVCPACLRSIPFDAKLCPYCGKKFDSYI